MSRWCQNQRVRHDIAQIDFRSSLSLEYMFKQSKKLNNHDQQRRIDIYNLFDLNNIIQVSVDTLFWISLFELCSIFFLQSYTPYFSIRSSKQLVILKQYLIIYYYPHQRWKQKHLASISLTCCESDQLILILQFISLQNNIFFSQQMFGIEGIQIYFPKTYVDQTDYQTFKNAGKGKYTKGLGQLQLSFANASEDVNSMSLTVVNNLLRNYNIHPSQVGRLEVGTETLLDKSKSTKTVLMTLFKGNNDIQGATSINACYGAMNALINTLNWISSPFWDGRYGIVVAADLAVYEDGPARCTGGAGSVAILIGPNGKITFNKERATFIDHVYDFYKPIPNSQYPIVDGKLSIDCYLRAVEECYKNLKTKCKNRNILSEMDFFCFHSPFYKMVQKAYNKLAKLQGNPSEQQINKSFYSKVDPTLQISQRIGNIYTGSLFSCLISLLTSNLELKNKNVMLFSYGSGLCSTMLPVKIHSNPLNKSQIESITTRLQNRVKVTPQQFTRIMLERQKNYGIFQGVIKLEQNMLDDNVFYLAQIDNKWRRRYEIKNPPTIGINKRTISSMARLQNLNKKIDNSQQFSKFYKLSINQRFNSINSISNNELDRVTLQSGGLSLQLADTMIENVIGKLSLPLAVVPHMVINNKKYMIPMCIQEPSVVAACSSIGKFLSPYSFYTSSTPNVMIGQVHLPNSQINEIHKIIVQKNSIIQQLNKSCQSMAERGGGVIDLRVRQLNGPFSKHYSVDIFVNVCEAMGANITNTLCEKTKEYLSKMGVKTGIAILSNYCMQRRASSFFQIPVKDMEWKGVNGLEVAEKIIQAFGFAKIDKYRAATHNKGIMNGIDSVCLATGQDWRAVQSSSHTFASRGNAYSPLTNYELIYKDGEHYFRGSLELPLSVGTKGGVLQKNPIYKQTLQILGNPSAQELSEIIVTVGLAQNFAALRALVIEGINKGHMVLHARTVAQKSGVPKHLIEEACKYMAYKKKYDSSTANEFMQIYSKPKL